MFDTDFYIQRITQSGTPENTAREIIRSIVDSQVDLVSTRDLTDAVILIKQDIAVLSLKITGLYLFMAAIAGGVAKLVLMP
jgi:hypothetical protein